ncbi:diguanylate cyclase domain-containing protein [Aliiroseovarius sp.]|uniref:GGDEF domain-containing protein n=1 Tax=Aliiroseovarius sp. TaxID=1872442 RepID=UPI003BA8BFB5
MHLLNSRLLEFTRSSPDAALGANDRFAIFVATTGALVMFSFALGHVLSGRTTLALLSALPGVMLILNIRSHLRARRWPAPPYMIMTSFAVLHTVEIWTFGLVNLLWVFPTVIAGALLSPGWAAGIYALGMLMSGCALAWTLGDLSLMWQFGLALILTWSFMQAGVAVVANLRRKLEEASARDALTGLFNRRSFDTDLETALNRTGGAALLLVDIDRFKHINDRSGHVGGDETLKALAGLLTSNCPTGGRVFRLGGDEFAILLPGPDAGQAGELARSLPPRICGALGVTASIGALHAGGGRDADSVYAEADALLYQAKAEGRDRSVFLASA